MIAKDKPTAQRAAKQVKVTYEELPAIVTIEQAIKAGSFFEDDNELQKGDTDSAFKKCDHIFEGSMRTGAQEHFYLETQSCLAFPLNENDEMVLYSSTQAPCDTQMIVATALGIPYNRVVCNTKRIGGGFGGKETRASFLAALVAVTANKVSHLILSSTE